VGLRAEMSAAHHFGPQLQMFIPAGAFGEAREAGALTFSEGGGDVEALNAKKVGEAKVGMVTNTLDRAEPGQETFYQNVAREGVKNPVSIRHEPDAVPRLQEGHHRVPVAVETRGPRDEIPVTHGGKAKNAEGEWRNYNAFPPAQAHRWVRKR
jgi:hypothetical protein